MINILIVDDNPAKTTRLRELFQSTLLIDTLMIQEATNNLDAAKLLQEVAFDLMVLSGRT